MKLETSIITFENENLQKHFKILSIDGKLRKQEQMDTKKINETPSRTKFTLTVDSLFNNRRLHFSMMSLTTDEFLFSNQTITHPIVFLFDDNHTPVKVALYMMANDELPNTDILNLIDSFDSEDLEEIIFNAAFSYFEKTNKYKLLTTFYN